VSILLPSSICNSLLKFLLDVSSSENDWSEESSFPYDSHSSWDETSSIDDEFFSELDEKAEIFLCVALATTHNENFF
jgi:hypothetical protein